MISLVLVSYRSTALAERAAASFRDEARRAGEEAEVVAVVNSGDPDEARRLGAVCERVVAPGGNLGYAGGLNAGVRAARGDLLLLSNPDVHFLPGSVSGLARAARSGGPTLAGPALFWDDAATLLLPPAEMPAPAEVVRRVLARDPVREGRSFRRAARKALALEEAVRNGAAAPAEALSGAVMAATRETFLRVGPLDERYRLYYEENDWQRRLLALGGRLLVSGEAHVVHRWAQSSRREPRSEEWFRASERRYFESHFGEAGRKALALDASNPPAWPASLPESPAVSWEAGRGVLVALSPVPWFRPFVVTRPPRGAGAYALPAEVAAGHAGTAWYARAFDVATFETVAEARLGTAGGGADAGSLES